MPTNGDTLIPNPEAKLYTDTKCESVYFLLGIMTARSIYEKILMESKLNHIYLRSILGKKNTMSQLANYDNELYLQLRKVKEMTSVEDLPLENGKSYELKPGGGEIDVDDSNKMEYISAYVEYKLDKQFQESILPFKVGFSKVVPIELIEIFNESEFEKLISGGERTIDVEDLRANSKYIGGYKPKDRYIRKFWNVVREFTEEEKKDLLKFVTCYSRPPLLGFAHLNPMFTVQKCEKNDDKMLPQSSTCFNTLKLPKYSSQKILASKLREAIKHNSGFYLA